MRFWQFRADFHVCTICNVHLLCQGSKISDVAASDATFQFATFEDKS